MMHDETKMHIEISNLGAINSAKFDLEPLTIVCGSNNMGKTYVTYALYGFLSFWWDMFFTDVDERYVNALISSRQVCIPLSECKKLALSLLSAASKAYSDPEVIAMIFGANSRSFSGASFDVSFANFVVNNKENDKFKRGTYNAHDGIEIKWEFDECGLKLLLLKFDRQIEDRIPRRWLLNRNMCSCFKRVFFDSIIPKPYIACAERTGAVIFQKELDFTRNRMMELLKEDKLKSMPPLFRLFNDYSVRYPLPIRNNVDIAREIPDGQESFLCKSQQEEFRKILELFSDIIGGEYKIVRGQAKFIPRGEQAKRLDMILSSSSVRALMHLGVYLYFQAKKGDILMMDEPEQNLHPSNQRKMARLLALLSNVGVSVFITSHSDYIVREFNTLVMLNRQNETVELIKRKFDYSMSERIDSNRIGVYCAKRDSVSKRDSKHRHITLHKEDIDPDIGVEADFFDETIMSMNEIQDELRMSATYD